MSANCAGHGAAELTGAPLANGVSRETAFATYPFSRALRACCCVSLYASAIGRRSFAAGTCAAAVALRSADCFSRDENIERWAISEQRAPKRFPTQIGVSHWEPMCRKGPRSWRGRPRTDRYRRVRCIDLEFETPSLPSAVARSPPLQLWGRYYVKEPRFRTGTCIVDLVTVRD